MKAPGRYQVPDKGYLPSIPSFLPRLAPLSSFLSVGNGIAMVKWLDLKYLAHSSCSVNASYFRHLIVTLDSFTHSPLLFGSIIAHPISLCLFIPGRCFWFSFPIVGAPAPPSVPQNLNTNTHTQTHTHLFSTPRLWSVRELQELRVSC